jgi:hypothetical protein
VIGVPGQPQLLLTSFLDAQSSCNLYDTRAKQAVIQFPTYGDKTLYQRVAISPHGYFVSAGNATGGLGFWDLRYIKVDGDPCQRINVDSKPS